MGGIDVDLSVYEDPAPKDDSRNLLTAPALPEPIKFSRKRKLPFRPDVAVEGRKYKGRRVSRSDAELDPDTLGLFDEEELSSDDGILERGDGSPRTSPSEDVEISEYRDSESEADSLADDDLNSDRDESRASDDLRTKRDAQLEKEERLVAERLAKAEKKEAERASAVRRQREIYDAVVDLRIKLEPLLTVARTFPSTEQRKNCKAWNASEELSEAMSNADAVLSSIASHSKTAWQASWPLEEDEENVDKAFSKWRDSVLDHWGQKVNEAQGVIPKGGFKTFDTTISAQMKSSIASGKPLERTRRVKQKVALVGGLELDAGSHDMQFDDGELYRTLLREIIESGEGVGGGLRYAQLSKGGRVKKKRDRALSKGKRLKYEVHEKLIGFLAPTPLPDPGPLNEILASLFGKMGTVKNDVE